MIDTLLNKLIHHFSGKRENAKLLIFNFHNIYQNKSPLSQKAIFYPNFKQQICWIHRHFEVLPLTTGVDLCRSAKLDVPTACITFDDGYSSQYSLAKSLLDELNIPATFFISSGHINKLLWNDHIPLFFHYSNEQQQKDFIKKLNAITSGNITPGSGNTALINAIDQLIKYLPVSQRESLLAYMIDFIPKEAIKGVMVTENEVVELSNSKHTIGGHTNNHPILAVENDRVAANEIGEDLNTLRELTNKNINIFAYPNGKPGKDYTDRDIQILLDNKIDYAVTTLAGCFVPGLDPLQIPRVNLSGNSNFKHYRTVLSAYHQIGKIVKSRGYEKTY